MTAAEFLARARARRVVPNRLARPLFWRLAIRNPEAVSDVVIESNVAFSKTCHLQLRLELASRQAWLMLFDGFRASDEAVMIDLFCRRARKARCVIDVGVNHGLYLYHAVAYCGPKTTIVGLEANPALVKAVNENLAMNGLGSLVDLAALTDREEPVLLYLGKDDMVSSLRSEHVDALGGAIASLEVPGITLDSFVAERGLSPDLIKIDVEGHEAAVVHGCQRTLAEHRPTVLIEVTPATWADVDATFRALSYRGQIFSPGGLCEPEALLLEACGYSNLLYEPEAP
jgi:FkbM family methyltransferase